MKTFIYIIALLCTLNPMQVLGQTAVLSADPGNPLIQGATCQNPIEIPPLPATLTDLTTANMGEDYAQAFSDCDGDKDTVRGNDVVLHYVSPGEECVSLNLVLFPNSLNHPFTLGVYQQCFDSNEKPHALWQFCGIDIENLNRLPWSFNLVDPGDYYFILSSGKVYPNATDSLYTSINFDLELSSSPLLGPGPTCNKSIPISNIPFSANNLSTACRVNDYRGDSSCVGEVLNGEDLVLEFTPTEDICAIIKAKNTRGQGGLVLYESCPDDMASQCLGSTLCPDTSSITGCPVITMNANFQAGKTYYILAGSTGDHDFVFDLEILPSNTPEQSCPSCPSYCPECENIGFEQGSLRYWTGYHGTYPNPRQTPGFVSSSINAPLSRHTIVNKGLFDPLLTTALPVTPPNGGDYALRLGNSQVGAEAEEISFTLTVTPETEAVYYSYALVLEDPGHTETSQPYFEVQVRDANTNQRIPCGEIKVFADQSPEFRDTVVNRLLVYRNWSDVTLALSNYMGQTITLTFLIKDCAAGGHFGYAYLDARCGPLEITQDSAKTICPGETTELIAPTGFQEYLWDDGSGGRTFTANGPGIYTVRLTPYANELASNDCHIYKSFEVLSSTKPVPDFEGPLMLCAPPESQTYLDKSYITDSIPIVDWEWTLGSTTWNNQQEIEVDFPGPGKHPLQLKVTNARGCFDTLTRWVEIKKPELQVNEVSNPKCYYSLDGSIQVEGSGGYEPYSYQLNQGEENSTGIFQNLAGSQNQIILTDSLGCTDTLEIELFPPDSIVVDLEIQAIECYGNFTGAISINASGGSPPLRYQINNQGYTSQSLFNNLPAGTYSIHVKDDEDCLWTTSVQLGQPDQALGSVVKTFDPLCFESSDGSLEIIGKGGTPPYEFQLNNGPRVSSGNFDNLNAGTYNYWIFDANGCQFSGTAQLTQPSEINWEIIEDSHPQCNTNNGSLEGQASGGIPPYQYRINNGSWQSSPRFEQLGANFHIVEVKDANDCIKSVVHILNNEGAIGFTAHTLQQPLCGQEIGELAVEIQIGSPPFTYQINGSPAQTDSIFKGLPAGTHQIQVTDNSGCTGQLSILLEEESTLDGELQVVQPTCLQANGSIEFIPTKNFGSIQTLWSNGESGMMKISDLVPGTYQLVVSDSFCHKEWSVELYDPGLPSLAITSVQPSTCSLNNGEIHAEANAGHPPYLFKIYSLPDTSLIEENSTGSFVGLPPSAFLLRLEDSLCSTDTSLAINALPPPDIELLAQEPSSCGLGNGSISIQINQMDSSLTHQLYKDSISGPAVAETTQNTFNNLEPGQYFVLSTEDGCSDTLGPITIIDQPLFQLRMDTVSPTTCSANNGTAKAIASGGSGQFLYQWMDASGNPLSNQSQVQGLAPGCYVLQVEDTLWSCSDSLSFCVDEIPPLSIDLKQVKPATCGSNNGSACIRVNQAHGSVNFQWLAWNGTGYEGIPGDSCAFNLAPGNYRLRLSDDYCTDSIDIQIDSIPDLGIALVNLNPSTCGLNNGSIALSGQGGNGNYQWNWFNFPGNVAPVGNTIQGLSPGQYCVALTDGICHDSLCLSIDSLPKVQATVIAQNASCGLANGQAFGGATSAIGSISYFWYDLAFKPIGSGSSITNLDAGNYFLIVEDSLCSDTIPFSIGMHAPVELSLQLTEHAKCDSSNGKAILIASGGNGTFEFSSLSTGMWQQREDSLFLDQLAAGQYCITARDSFCSDTLCFTIEDLGNIKVAALANPDTCLQGKGSIELVVLQGAPPYQYQWNTGQSNPVLSQLSAQDYHCSIIDSLNCQWDSTISITNWENKLSQASYLQVYPEDIESKDSVWISAIIEWGWNPWLWSNTQGPLAQNVWQLDLFYDDPMQDEICLIAIDTNNCLDTLCEGLEVKPQIQIYIPNAFSPNGNGMNDLWSPVVTGIVEWKGNIVNRWGEVIFTFSSMNQRWDGKTDLQINKQDVYAYQFWFIDRNGEEHYRQGSVTLIR